MLNAVKSAYGGKKIIYLFLIVHCTLNIDNCFCQWVQVSNGMGNLIVNALAYSGNNLYAGTNVNGVYLSTDNGANWTQTSLNSEYISSLAIYGNNIYAGSIFNGIYLSTNNGANWSLVLGNSESVTALAVNNNYVYTGVANNGIYVSTNYGTNWAQAMGGFCFALAVNGSNVFAGRYSGPLMGVYKSTNNGANWTLTSLNNRIVFSLAVNGNNVFAGTTSPGYGVYLSTDNGSNWNQTSLNTHFIPALAVNGNNVFAAADSVGVYVSTDNGTNWTQRNEGLTVLRVRSFTIFNNYIFAGTYFGGVYRRPLSELTGIQPISAEIPNKFSLSQNYPNPFNPETKIKFQIPKLDFVNINVFDVLGRKIISLVNENLSPGTYEADWNASNYPSGVYYYKLIAGEYTETRKMILLK